MGQAQTITEIDTINEPDTKIDNNCDTSDHHDKSTTPVKVVVDKCTKIDSAKVHETCALQHILDTTGEYVYAIAIQSTQFMLFSDGYSGLNMLGYLSSFDAATIAARELSMNIPEYNVFIFRQESGIRIDPINYEDYCAIEKWRSGELIHDDDMDQHQIIQCNNIDDVIYYFASDGSNK